MKRFFCSALAIASLACVAVLAFADDIGDRLITAVRSGRYRIKHFLLDAIEAVAQPAAAVRDAIVLFVAAKSFVQRIVRRERLHVTPGWRLCPSI
jgi:hypothetical protein